MPDLPISEGELHSFRHTVDTFLAGTAVIQGRTATTGAAGGQIDNWAALTGGTVKARLAPEQFRGGERVLAGRVVEVTNWILTLPAHTPISESNRVVYDSRTYQVVEVLTRVPEEVSRRVRLVEVSS